MKKRLTALLLAAALVTGGIVGITLADDSTDVIATVQTGDTITECRSNTEIANAISTDGTSVVTMLQDYVKEGGSFLWNVPSFTMNLNGFTVGSTTNNAITVSTAGTANAVTNIVGPGVVTAGNNTICMRAGSVNVEQGVIAYSAAMNALLIDDDAADGSENCVKDSTLVADASFPVRFGTVDGVNLSLSDTTVVAAASGAMPVGCANDTPTNVSVTLGSGVKFYTTEESCVFNGCTTNYMEYEQYKDSDDDVVVAEMTVQTTDKSASVNVYVLDKTYSGLNSYVTRIPETTAMRQQAMIETGMAYYHKGVNVQYDRKALYWGSRTYGVRTYLNEMNAPEYASEHLTIYSVCSTFAYDVIYNTFGYSLFGDLHKAVTENMSDANFLLNVENLSKEDQVAVIYSWDESSETTATAAAAAAYELVQPGDVITYYRYGGSGHTVIYAYDMTGDGNPDLINSGSKAPGQQRYDLDNGVDYEEVTGTVFFNNNGVSSLNSAYNYLFNPEVKSQYLGNTDVLSETSSSRIVRFTIMRPTNMQYTLTEATRTRLENPGLEIVYNTQDTSYYGSVVNGGELTYELTLTNHGNDYIKGAEQDTAVLDVVIPVPEGTSLLRVNGKEKTGETVAFTAVVPYGETVTYTYTVRVTAESGSLIRALGGKIGNIALPKLNTTVTSYMPTAKAMQSDTARAAAAKAESSGAAFANAWYKAAFGHDPQLPELSTILRDHFTLITKDTLTYKGYEPNGYVSTNTDPDLQCDLPDMMVPNYYGGRSLRVSNTSQRVLKTRVQDLLPGDVLLIDDDLMDEVEAVAWVYDGEKLWALEDGQLVEKTAEGHYDADKPYLLTGDMTALHSYDFFMLLRPAQMLAEQPVLAAGSSWLGDVGEIPNLSKVEIVDHITDSTCTDVIKTWDASADQTGSVSGWLFDNGDGTCTLTMAGNGYGSICANADSSGLFSCLSCESSYTISGLDLLDTSNVTDMSGMFSSDGMLTGTLDLSTFDTSKVTDMEGMFYGSNVETIYVSDKWSTDKVTSDFHMFGENWKLVGGSGIKWANTMCYDKSYAKIDGGSKAPGYLTGK